MRIAVIVPSGDMIHADVAANLIRIILKLSAEGIEAALINPRSSLIQRGRMMGVKEALDLKVNYIYFQDSDVQAPDDVVIRLLAARKDIIVGSYPRRRWPFTQTCEDNLGRPIAVSGKRGIGKVHRAGAGCMLIRDRVFLMVDYPWFNTPFQNGELIGEDQYFCDQARIKGVQPWVDYDLSRELKHYGVRPFDYTDERSQS